MLLISVVSGNGKRVQRINAHASLDTPAHLLSIEPGHFLFVQKIVYALVNVTKAINLFPCKMRCSRSNTFIIRVKRKIICFRHDINPGGHPKSPTYGHLKIPHLVAAFKT